MANSELATRLAAEITGTFWGYLELFTAAWESTGRQIYPFFLFLRAQTPP